MDDNEARVGEALRQLFLPLADVLLKNGVSVGLVNRELKLAFATAAHLNHGNAGKPASVNRISTVTGMSRRHVKQLLCDAEIRSKSDQLSIPYESSVLATWVTSESYVDDMGMPLALPREGENASFRSLVIDATGDDRVEECLRRLLRSKTVVRRDDGWLELQNRDYSISEDLPRIIASALAPLAATINENWGKSRAETFCQRVSHSTCLDSRKIPTIRRISKERVATFLEDIDDLLTSFESEKVEEMVNPEGNELARVGVGAYYFEIERLSNSDKGTL